MEIILLHSAQVEASRAIAAQLGGEPAEADAIINKDGRDVRVVSKHSLAVGLCPSFSAYPAIAVVEDGGAIRCKSPVASWAECLDFVDSAPAGPAQPAHAAELSKLQFLGLFTDEEKISLKALEGTDPTVALFWEEYRTADNIRLDDPRTVRALDYLAAQGYLAQGRKEGILGL
ncbi:MAG: hypothetical protein ACOZEN_12285 [Thermodesulfobacteriota bacterium]